MPLSKVDRYQVDWLMFHTATSLPVDDTRLPRAILSDCLADLPLDTPDCVRETYSTELQAWLVKRARSINAYKRRIAKGESPPQPLLRHPIKDRPAVDAMALFESQSELARLLGVKQPSVSSWQFYGVPIKRRDHIEFLVNQNLDW